LIQLALIIGWPLVCYLFFYPARRRADLVRSDVELGRQFRDEAHDALGLKANPVPRV
jgi:hypothetical protein